MSSVFREILEIFEKKISRVFISSPLVVGVSGGPDSMFLLFLLKSWCAKKYIHLVCLTVDHGFLDDERVSAEHVVYWCRRYGIEHYVLKNKEKIESAYEEKWRNVRYKLLEKWCYENGALHLFVGHHKDDQVETFLMRMGKSTGTKGLKGMACYRLFEFVFRWRPLLDFTRKEIRNLLLKNNIPFLLDKDNFTFRNTRALLRNNLEQPFFDFKGISVITNRLLRVNKAVDRMAVSFLSKNIEISSYGYLRLPIKKFFSLAAETAIRSIFFLIKIFNGENEPRLSKIERVFLVLKKRKKKYNLARCLFCQDLNYLYIFYEGSRGKENYRQQLSGVQRKIWQKVFYIRVIHLQQIIQLFIEKRDIRCTVEIGKFFKRFQFKKFFLLNFPVLNVCKKKIISKLFFHKINSESFFAIDLNVLPLVCSCFKETVFNYVCSEGGNFSL